MTRVVLDTSIYVDWFRARRHGNIVGGQHGPPVLSAVVAMELLLGARSHERIARWAEAFHGSRRLLTPSWAVWKLAARVLRELGVRGKGAHAIANDVFIAMTARVAGFRLFTTNRNDFERIAAIEPFELVVVDGGAQ